MSAKDLIVIDQKLQAEPEVARSQVVLHTQPQGASGTDLFGGMFAEEYLDTLQGSEAAKVYEKMKRSEAQIKMVLSAVKNPILSGKWGVEEAKLESDASEAETKEAKLHADFIKHVLFERINWTAYVTEALSMIDKGHAVFEVIHEQVVGDKKFGNFTGIKALGFRAQKTLEFWDVDKTTGELLSLTQIVDGDLSGPDNGTNQDLKMDGRFLIVYSIEKEGDNFEGISMLRPCFGPFIRKCKILKLDIIGIEKYAIPPILAKYPAGQENSVEYNAFKAALEAWTSHEKSYLLTPDNGIEGKNYSVELKESNYDSSKVEPAINREDKLMVKAFLANFLELGMSTTGSWALSFDQSDFFLSSLVFIVKLFCEPVNSKLVKDLIDMKYGPQEKYPKVVCKGISDKAGKELATIYKTLADGKIVTPDLPLEEDARKRFDMPEMSEAAKLAREKQAELAVNPPTPPDPNDPNNPEPPNPDDPPKDPDDPPADPPKDKPPAEPPKKKVLNDNLALQERVSTQIKKDRKTLRAKMQVGLLNVADDLISQVIKNFDKATDANKVNATKGVQARGVGKYKSFIREDLEQISLTAFEKVRTEIPSKSDVKLTAVLHTLGGTPSIFLQDDPSDLPTGIKKRINRQADLLGDTQTADLEKAVFFQFTGSVDSTRDSALIRKDLEDAAQTYIDSAGVATAAGNQAGKVINDSRNTFFFDKEVIDEIESFTFINFDPQSPICIDLAGRTFAKDDPEAQRNHPPLHHNCESFLRANLVGNQNPPIDPRGLFPSNPTLNKFITL